MPRKKNVGDLQKPVSVRFDEPILKVLRAIARDSPSARGETSTVVRSIVTMWLTTTAKPHDAYERVAQVAHKKRASYVAGVKEAEVDADSPAETPGRSKRGGRTGDRK